MKLSDCIQSLQHFIDEDGDLTISQLSVNEEQLFIKVNDIWYEFQEYKQNKEKDKR